MKLVKKLLGLDKVEESIKLAAEKLEQLEKQKEEAEKAAKLALEQEEEAKLTPKDRATRRKEPWVGVLNTHMNKEVTKLEEE